MIVDHGPVLADLTVEFPDELALGVRNVHDLIKI